MTKINKGLIMSIKSNKRVNNQMKNKKNLNNFMKEKMILDCTASNSMKKRDKWKIMLTSLMRKSLNSFRGKLVL